MPIGLSNFQELAKESYTYIDKTLFIKEVLDTGNKVLLITRPRRFGKTLNMRMLYAFLSNKKLEEDPFEHLAITQAAPHYQAERGKRPVLYLSFKDIKGSTWEKAFQEMQILLAGLVNKNLLQASVQELTDEKQYVLRQVGALRANDTETGHTLKLLTELLALQHGEKPWVLIDEYDTPMQAAYQHGFYHEMRDLMRSLLSGSLKDNNYLHKSVITGILRVAKEDIFSGLNNLGTYGVMDKGFSKHFGFTQEEVDALLEVKGLGTHKKTVRDWYNGYQFGSTTIYNPWSITNFVDREEEYPKCYWVNTSNNYLVHSLLARADAEVKQDVQTLLQHPTGHTISKKIHDYIPLSELEDDASNLWSILLVSGYLTAIKPKKADLGDTNATGLRFPNKEVRSLYEGLVERWIERKHQGFSGAKLISYLKQNDIESFAEYFPMLFNASASYFDAGNNQPEKFYHGFLVGMLQHLRHEYSVLSQRESGVGRYDLALIPQDKTRAGFVFEFKRCPKKGSLETIRRQLADDAKVAIAQIKARTYPQGLFAEGVNVVHAIGFAFSGKEVSVAFETLTA